MSQFERLSKEQVVTYSAYALVAGLVLGVVIGSIVERVALGIVIGAVVGVAVSAWFQTRRAAGGRADPS